MHSSKFAADIFAVQSIGSVPTVMQMISEITGVRFVCVARVTDEHWVTCAVHDKLEFGLQPGDELDLITTICDEIRASKKPVIIDAASQDANYCNHQTPKLYGFESYFSMPIYRQGEFFGTLCGIDPLPADLNTPATSNTLGLFADLISRELESQRRLESIETDLKDERTSAELREQFIAVLGHDLRTPLSSIMLGTQALLLSAENARAVSVLQRIERSARRISSLIDDVMDFTRGRMGSGIPLQMVETSDLSNHLSHVVAELESNYNQRTVHTDINVHSAVRCDTGRIAQLTSNLLVNALVHGAPDEPINLSADCREGVLRISVSNGGAPIADDTIARLFQPFWRAPGSSPGSGLGLGLYIANEIARAHGGVIEVTSTPARTTFVFSAKLDCSDALAPAVVQQG